MKKITLLTSLLLSTLFLTGEENVAPPKVEKLGLISELVYLKMNTEHFAIRITNDSIIADTTKMSFVKQYNTAKTLLDQILLQLIADCRGKNSLKYYKKLDKQFSKKKFADINPDDFKKRKLKSYLVNLKIVSAYFTRLNSFKIEDEVELISMEGFLPAAITAAEITGAMSFITSTIKDARESRQKKVEKITEMLNELRLNPVQQLLTKPDKDKKDDK
jgi:hypothetical protein